jgi:hypothetical protein
MLHCGKGADRIHFAWSDLAGIIRSLNRGKGKPMLKNTRYVVAGIAAVLLVACQPGVKPGTEASVDGKEVASSQRYEMKPLQSSFGAQLTTQGPPTYPANLVDQRLSAQDIRVKVVVDGTGRVSDVLDLYPKSTDAHHAAFFAAVREAALKWQYTPMTVVQQEESRGGMLREISRETKPFSLDYAYRFTVNETAPVVTSVAMP